MYYGQQESTLDDGRGAICNNNPTTTRGKQTTLWVIININISFWRQKFGGDGYK